MLHRNSHLPWTPLELEESYRELGLESGCSDAQVKAAWRRLAARWHPDRNASPQALRKIQRINRALNEIRVARQMALPAHATDAAAPEPAATLQHRVEITLEQALTGCAIDLAGERAAPCAQCEGSGQQAQPARCDTCGGSGRCSQALWFGWAATVVTCAACDGQGATRVGCEGCAGTGQGPTLHYRCRVQVPPGVRDGDTVMAQARVRGDRRRRPLEVRITLLQHEFFTLDADGTVRLALPVDGFAWTAQRWIDVPTLDGPQQMRLRRDALVYRIKGQGFAVRGDGPRADCIVSIEPLFPQALSAAQEALVDALVAHNTGDAATTAGHRSLDWHARFDAWQARRGA